MLDGDSVSCVSFIRIAARRNPFRRRRSFTTDEANGSVTLLFSFDGSGYIGKELVAFERIYDADGNLIGIHENLEDEMQTVKVIQPEPAPKTGDESQLFFWGVITALSLAAVIVISRKVIKEEETV